MSASSSKEMATMMELRVVCRDHPDATIIEDYRAGDQICSECGLIVGDRLVSQGAEWRTFNKDGVAGDPSRVGGAENPMLNTGDLSTLIVGGSGDAAFDKGGVAKYAAKRKMTATDRALQSGFRQINMMAERLNNFPKAVSEQACHMFKKVFEKQTLKGKSGDAISSACFYLACRQEGVARTYNEVCAASKISKREIGKCYKLILQELDTPVDMTTETDFVGRFCRSLGLPKTVHSAATAIARGAMTRGVVPGRHPISVYSAAIYMASQASEMPKSQKEIGAVAGVAPSTIRQSYRMMYGRAEDLFPKDFHFVTPIYLLPLL